MRARPTDESGWAAPGPWTVRARPTDDDWIDWAANCDPAELDDYCFPMQKLKFKLDGAAQADGGRMIGWWPGPASRASLARAAAAAAAAGSAAAADINRRAQRCGAARRNGKASRERRTPSGGPSRGSRLRRIDE